MDDEPAAVIARLRPDLAGQAVRRIETGWDSLALEVGGVLFKFPRHAAAAMRLRTEARALAALAGHVALTIPRMHLEEGPPLCSWHQMIPGAHLLAADYDQLGEGARQGLAETLAGFLADLHAVDQSRMVQAGAGPVGDWLGPEALAARSLPLLPVQGQAVARAVLAAYAALPPDPLGLVYGFFDLHGWNMAFDHAAGHLNGVYDFGDAGFGPLHREFVYPSFLSADLVARMVAAYERRRGLRLDRARIACLTGAHRLWELAATDEGGRPAMLANFETFCEGWTGWLATG